MTTAEAIVPTTPATSPIHIGITDHGPAVWDPVADPHLVVASDENPKLVRGLVAAVTLAAIRAGWQVHVLDVGNLRTPYDVVEPFAATVVRTHQGAVTALSDADKIPGGIPGISPIVEEPILVVIPDVSALEQDADGPLAAHAHKLNEILERIIEWNGRYRVHLMLGVPNADHHRTNSILQKALTASTARVLLGIPRYTTWARFFRNPERSAAALGERAGVYETLTGSIEINPDFLDLSVVPSRPETIEDLTWQLFDSPAGLRDGSKPSATDGSATRIPVGLFRDGEQAFWDASVDPHLFVTGPESQATDIVRAVAAECEKSGWRTVTIGPDVDAGWTQAALQLARLAKICVARVRALRQNAGARIIRDLSDPPARIIAVIPAIAQLPDRNIVSGLDSATIARALSILTRQGRASGVHILAGGHSASIAHVIGTGRSLFAQIVLDSADEQLRRIVSADYPEAEALLSSSTPSAFETFEGTVGITPTPFSERSAT